MTQQLQFKNIENINIYNGNTEASQTVKMDPSLQEWLVDIGNAVSEATGNSKYGASTVAREAIVFYKTFYNIHKKLLKYRGAVQSLLKNLP